MDIGGAKRCGGCGHALDADEVFCGKCGARYVPPAAAPAAADPGGRPASGRACPNCGGELRWDALFCPGCGHNCSRV